MIDLKALPTPIYQKKNIVNTLDEFWTILNTVKPKCTCGFHKQIIIMDFADIINFQEAEARKHYDKFGKELIETESYKITLAMGIKLHVNKTGKRKVLAAMGTHLIVECPNCKNNYTP